MRDQNAQRMQLKTLKQLLQTFHVEVFLERVAWMNHPSDPHWRGRSPIDRHELAGNAAIVKDESFDRALCGNGVLRIFDGLFSALWLHAVCPQADNES